MFTFRDIYGEDNRSAEGATYCKIAISGEFEVEIICSISVLKHRFVGNMHRLF